MNVDLTDVPIFVGLEAAALEEIRGRMTPRRFRARSFICRQGEPGGSLLLIRHGLAQVFVEQPDGAAPVARLRAGDIIGEMSLLTGESRSASVRALVPTEALELGQEAFATLAERYPVLLANLGRVLSQRLSQSNRQRLQAQRRGEAVALVTGTQAVSMVPAVVAAIRAASPDAVAAFDLVAETGVRGQGSGVRPAGTVAEGDARVEAATLEGFLDALDDRLAAHATVVAIIDAGHERLSLLLEHVDRVVVLGSEADVERPAAMGGPRDGSAEVILLSASPEQAARRAGGLPVVRAIHPEPRESDLAWLGRHLSRTKLGLALGAGGAKGYAHVGALRVLEEAGYPIDVVAGSSIGAVVGAWLALGKDAAQIEATMRQVFTLETVEAIFRPPASGRSAGWETMARLWRETTEDRSFSDLAIPFVAMTVDLRRGEPAPITEGPLWQALLAAAAVPGIYPPYEYQDGRLVDGVALVPVPTEAVLQAGADIAIAVNIMDREPTASPGEIPPTPSAERGMQALDAMLDLMELTWRDSSIRHAAVADVVITPRFASGNWRSFHLADAYLAAGRAAAEAQIEALRTRARPQTGVQALRHSGTQDGLSERPNAQDHRYAGYPPKGGWMPPERLNAFTLDDMRQILARLQVLRGREAPDDPGISFEELGLDSIAFLEIQIEIEQRYGFHVSEEEARQIRTLGDAVEFVNQRLGRSAPTGDR